MNKQDFLWQLRKGLSGYPENEVEERLAFYGELIDDRAEECGSEEEAVARIGRVEDIISQIASDIPLTRIVKERIAPAKKPSAFTIVLLVLGSPVWLSLLIAAFAVLLPVYAVIWAVILFLWAVFLALIAAALVGFAFGIRELCLGRGLRGGVLLCAGCVLSGLSILLFFGCRVASVGAARLTGKIALWIKTLFRRKENHR